MTDVRSLIKDAIQGIEQDEKEPKNKAIREIIRVERNYYYSGKSNANRLKEIRVIVNRYSEEDSDNVDK